MARKPHIRKVNGIWGAYTSKDSRLPFAASGSFAALVNAVRIKRKREIPVYPPDTWGASWLG